MADQIPAHSNALLAWQRLVAKLDVAGAGPALREAALSLYVLSKLPGQVADMAATALQRVEDELDREMANVG